MNIELKSFQEEAARQLLKDICYARQEARDGKPQAIVLSSPTGSGKTVTITALMEWIYEGHETTMGDPEAVFLWLSDSPELNLQSRDKILRQSSIFQESNLIVVEPPFSQEHFEAGKIYFLNTQKLAKDNLLTKTGDGRVYTTWQTIQNTANAKPGHFYVIIDEAHRVGKQNSREFIPIMRRFINGYHFPEVKLQPVKLIIGISATPKRFNVIIEGSDRIRRNYTIQPKDVKGFGLLKEKIILFHPDSRQPADWAMLEEATRRWLRFCEEWEKYCLAQRMEQTVKPVFVIQLEDGSSNSLLTLTDLDKVIEIVERNTGILPENAWVHAFQDDKTIEVGGRKIRKLEASKIQDDPDVRVVLFKMSLNTGWDCPRAEVLMSFRKAHDPTNIEQLVGRMIRTPLARSIEGQEFLNTIALYLPHYDPESLNAIISKLNNPDPEAGLGIEAEDGTQLVALIRNPTKSKMFSKLEGLPTYWVERIAKASNLRRLMKLARQLTSFDEIDQNALGEAKALILETLSNELARLRKNSDFISTVAENEEIELQEVWIEYGEWKAIEPPKTLKIKIAPESIDDLFIQCGRRLSDEGLHMEFWKAQQDRENSFKAKLELFGVLQDKAAWEKLEQACEVKMQQLFRKNYEAIESLPSSRREYYRRIKRIAKQPEHEPLCLPQNFEMKMIGEEFRDHLFINSSGKFGTKLNTWETPVLKKELARPEVIGWLRNLPRKEWLCVPYKMDGDDKQFFPDFVIFRELEGRIVIDILDPHSTHLPDAVPKAKGLAEYARQHGDHYERIEFIIIDSKDETKRLDLNNESIREKVLRVESKAHLEQLFEDWG